MNDCCCSHPASTQGGVDAMDDQVLEFPCPMCGVEGRLRMRTWSEAIPYFGEHTQISLLCEACGWQQTDFIPEDGDEPRAVALEMESEEDLSARVVRSPTGMVRLVDLDLEVLPGRASSGYVTNVEGVLARFEDIVQMVARSAESEADTERLLAAAELSQRLAMLREGIFDAPVTLEVLDPRGRSRILHERSTSRGLTDEELEVLSIETHATPASELGSA